MSRTMRFCNNQQMKKEKFSISSHTFTSSIGFTRHHRMNKRKLRLREREKPLQEISIQFKRKKISFFKCWFYSQFPPQRNHPFPNNSKFFSESRKSSMKELQFLLKLLSNTFFFLSFVHWILGWWWWKKGAEKSKERK